MQKTGNKIGRPSLYKPEYCQAIVDYFDKDPYQKVNVVTGHSDGKPITKTELKANDLPFLAGFAKSIGVNRDTVNEWAKHHPDFSVALKKAKELQEQMLATNGLHGLYNPTFAIFTAKNVAGWRDKVETGFTDNEGKDLDIAAMVGSSLRKVYGD